MKKVIAAICLIAIFSIGVYIGTIPDEFSAFSGEKINSRPFITFDLGSTQTLKTQSLKEGNYEAKIKLFGFLPIKDAKIKIIEKQQLVPLGMAFGVKLYTDGVIVVDITDFVHNGIVQNPAYNAGLREGDIITKYNGVSIQSNEDLIEQVKLYDGTPQIVEFIRNNLNLKIEVTPLRDDSDGSYRIGLWVRDSTAGIGMLTYYNKNANLLAGLGHSISDVDTGLKMPVSKGEIVKANINSVIKGKSGAPGELIGSFIPNSTIGVLNKNDNTGVVATCVVDEFDDLQSYPIALKNDIVKGKAQILCCVDGVESKSYDIEITKINNNLQETKNMVIKITDSELLEKTNGIIQGMSGSPIIQNGKLIGAVTHVLVDDPTRGYGIFIENMLETAQSVAEKHQLKEAS